MKSPAPALAGLLVALLLPQDLHAQCPSGSAPQPGSRSSWGNIATAPTVGGPRGAALSSAAARSNRSRAALANPNSAAAATSGTGSGVRGGSGRSGPTSGGAQTTGSGMAGRDLDSWSTWWARNQDAFLWDVEPSASRTPTTPITAAGRGMRQRGQRGVSEPTRPPRSMIYTAIVPSLLELVEHADDPRVVDAAVRALGTTVEAPFQAPVSEALLPLLADDSGTVRLSATLALGLLGDTDTKTLLELATCSSEGHRLVGKTEVPRRVRAAATLALGYADDPRSVASLIDLIERLPDTEADTKRSAIHALGIMRNPRASVAVDYLLSKLHDERLDPNIRSAIPTALGRHGRLGTIDTLLALLEDRDTDRRVMQSVVIGLGQLASVERSDVLDVLVEIIEHSSDSPTRHFAYMSLAAVGARESGAGLDGPAHEMLSEFLGKAVSKPRRSLDRPWAALATGIYVRAHPEQRAKLAARLIDAYADVKDPSVRGAFALGLGLAGIDAAGEDLLKDFERSGDETLRGHLALALGFLGEEDATAAFGKALRRKGTGTDFRRSMGLACRLIGDLDAPTAIVDYYETEASLDGRRGLSEALGVLQHRDGVSALRRAAADETLDAPSRASACAALGRVAEKTRAPWYAALRMDSNYMADAGATLDEILGVY